MHFLSLETSTQSFALAVSKDDQVLAARHVKSSQILEKAILSIIDRVLESAKVPFKKLDAFAIGLGPGSFTSLRIGLSTVKAFAMATGKPIIGINSLDVIAAGAAHMTCDQVCVIVDARRNLLYGAIYTKTAKGLKRQGDYLLADLKSILDQVKGTTVFVGDGVGLHQETIEEAYKKSGSFCTAVFAPPKVWLPKAQHLAQLAYERLAKGKFDKVATLVPVYLYASDCQVTRGVKK